MVLEPCLGKTPCSYYVHVVVSSLRIRKRRKAPTSLTIIVDMYLFSSVDLAHFSSAVNSVQGHSPVKDSTKTQNIITETSFVLTSSTPKSPSKQDHGPVSTRNNRVLNGPLGRSLRSFARTAHSLRSAPLRYARFATLAPFTGSLTHFAHSLVGWLEFMNLCSY